MKDKSIKTNKIVSKINPKDSTLNSFQLQVKSQEKNKIDKNIVKLLDNIVSRKIKKYGVLNPNTSKIVLSNCITFLINRCGITEDFMKDKYKQIVLKIIAHKNKNAPMIAGAKPITKSILSDLPDIPNQREVLLGPEAYLESEKQRFDEERKKFLNFVDETGCELESVHYARRFFDIFDKYHERAIRIIRDELDIDYNALLSYDDLLKKKIEELEQMQPAPFDEILARLKTLVHPFLIYRNNLMVILGESGFLDLDAIRDDFGESK